MDIKRKGGRRPVHPGTVGDAGQESKAATESPRLEKIKSTDTFEDTNPVPSNFSSSGEGMPQLDANARPSGKRNFALLLQQTQSRLLDEHRTLQSDVKALIADSGGDLSSIGDQLGQMRGQLEKIRRRLSTLRRRSNHLAIDPRRIQQDLRPNLNGKISSLAQYRPDAVNLVAAPEHPVAFGGEYAKGARSLSVTRQLLSSLTGSASES